MLNVNLNYYLLYANIYSRAKSEEKSPICFSHMHQILLRTLSSSPCPTRTGRVLDSPPRSQRNQWSKLFGDALVLVALLCMLRLTNNRPERWPAELSYMLHFKADKPVPTKEISTETVRSYTVYFILYLWKEETIPCTPWTWSSRWYYNGKTF